MSFFGTLAAWGFAAMLAVGALPDPYQRADQPTIGPAPVPVMEQMFWVQMKLDPAVEVKIACPNGVRLLDKTKPGKNRQYTRFYFRADRGMKDAEITLRPQGAAEIRIPLRVLTYREDIDDKSKNLPGFSDSVRKQGRSFYSDEMVAQGKREGGASGRRRGAGEPSDSDGRRDEKLWQSLPSWSVPREVYSNWACPYCGEKILQINPYYPWNKEGAFRCTCPICKRSFPSNDISKDDYTSGEFPDDGWGWDRVGTGEPKSMSAWVAYANEGHWLGLRAQLSRLSQRGLFLDDKKAAHQVGVLLARMAYVYPGMHIYWQQPRRMFLRNGKFTVDSNFDATLLLEPAIEAYDAIWEHVGHDQELAEFLHTKDPTIRTPEDVRRLIDVYLVQHYGLNLMRRWHTGGGFQDFEAHLIEAALAANMGEASDRWLKEVFTHTGYFGPPAGGLQDSLINHCTREGLANDGAVAYSRLAMEACDKIAPMLDRYPDPVWRERCNLYDERQFPRFRAAFDGYLDMRVAGVFVPNFGDDGSASNSIRVASRGLGGDAGMYLRAYGHWPSDRIAWELYQEERRNESIKRSELWPRIEAQARRAGPPPPLQSRVLDDTGLAILESRYQEPELRDRAGLALRYGYGYRTHQHQDALNVQFWAFGTCMAPEMGYPNWTHPFGATAATYHHITGMIDDKGSQYRGRTGKGTLETFANSPEAAFADVSAMPTAFKAKVYRRAVSLLNGPGNNCYVFDVLRLKGGTKRTYTFHGPVYEGFESNLAFGEKGEKPVYQNLLEPQYAKSDVDVTATWKVKDKPLSFRLHLLGRPGRQYMTARYGKVDSPPIRMLFANETQADGQSEYTALWEPYAERPFIEQIERLAVTGGEAPEGFAPVAVRVTLADGQVDTLLYSCDAGSLHQIGDIAFRGKFGYISELHGKLRCLHLVGGDRLLRSGEGLEAKAANHTAKVVSADLWNHRFTLDRKLPADGRLDGRQMRILAGGKHRVSYRVAGIVPPGNVVAVDLPTEIFQSRIASIDAKGGKIICDIPPPVEKPYLVAPGFYCGAVLTDETRKARYRVLNVDDKTIDVGPITPADFQAKDAFDRRMVRVFDLGEGDEITVDGSIFARKINDGTWETKATGDFNLRLCPRAAEKPQAAAKEMLRDLR